MTSLEDPGGGQLVRVCSRPPCPPPQAGDPGAPPVGSVRRAPGEAARRRQHRQGVPCGGGISYFIFALGGGFEDSRWVGGLREGGAGRGEMRGGKGRRGREGSEGGLRMIPILSVVSHNGGGPVNPTQRKINKNLRTRNLPIFFSNTSIPFVMPLTLTLTRHM